MESSEKVVKELHTRKDEGEVLLLLKYELDKKNADQPDETREVVRSTFNRISRTSRADVVDAPSWFISDADVSYDPRPIGAGSFGRVCKGTWRNGAVVAVKFVLPEKDCPTEKTAEALRKEADVWSNLNHPNVAKMWGACHVTSEPFIVSEFASRGSLSDYLGSSYAKDTSAKIKWMLLKEAAQGLQYLHNRNIVHGHLKLTNILIGDDGHARVTDFGLSRTKESSMSYQSKLEEGEVVIGGAHWVASELFTERTTKYSDIYALAMCFIEAEAGEAPYGLLSTSAIKAKIKAGELPKRPDRMCDAAWNLFLAMTKFEPKQRMPLASVIQQLVQRSATRKPSRHVLIGFELDRLSYLVFGGMYLISYDDWYILTSMCTTLATIEEEQHSESKLLCLACDKPMPPKGKFCKYCGLPLSDTAVAPGDGRSFILPPPLNVLEDLKSEGKKDSALKLLYRHVLIKIDSANRNAVSSHVPALAKILKASSGDVRDSVVVVLAAVFVHHEHNLSVLCGCAGIAELLVTALTEAFSSATEKAMHVLAQLTTSSPSIAEACATEDAIDAIIFVMRKHKSAAFASALHTIASIAEQTQASDLIGSRGAVADLVRAPKSEAAYEHRVLALRMLAYLVKDEGNASQFKRRGGVSGVDDALAVVDGRGKMLQYLAKMAENSDYMRRVLAESSAIHDQCVASLQTGSKEERHSAAYVCRELVREGPVVIQELDNVGGFEALRIVAQTNDEFAGSALVNAIKTLLKTRAQDEPSTKRARIAAS